MHKLLKKYYFIGKFDTKYIDKQDKNTVIIYRNYSVSSEIATIQKFKSYCKKKGFKFILANNIKLAINLNLDGVYIPSFNKSFSHLSYNLKKKFLIIGSGHNLKEIRQKEIQKIKLIFLSSIFKKNNNYLGVNKFKNLSNNTKLRIVALGGINKNNLKKLKLVNCIGFAGISYFE
jgi:thiamine-phosphate pyrophosphorylase